MFKKFNPKEDVASASSVKSSVQRTIRTKLLDQYPLLSAPASVPTPATAAAGTQAGNGDDDAAAPDEETNTGGKKKGNKKDKREASSSTKKSKNKSKQVEETSVSAPAQDQPPQDEDTNANKTEETFTLMDAIWPKKDGVTLVKCREHISILALHGEPLFFQHFDGPYYPTLKLLHRYPNLMPHVQVDRGAIKFVMGGANIMCPGLTSPTAALPEEDLPVGTPVAVHAFGKEHAVGIGLLTMSINDIKTINKNAGVENITYLGDDLWHVTKL